MNNSFFPIDTTKLSLPPKYLHIKGKIWINMKSTWSFILAFLGNITVFNSESAGMLLSSCSILQVFSFSAASTFPVDGAGEEHAESAGWGEVLSLLLVLSLSSSSSSSSLDKMTIKKVWSTSGISFLSVKNVSTWQKLEIYQICFGSPPDLRLIKMKIQSILFDEKLNL